VASERPPLEIILADYNPSVLYLVTLPNFILTWALQHQDHSDILQQAFTPDGELELTPEVMQAFQSFLASSRIALTFLSGGWSSEFVEILYGGVEPYEGLQTFIMGAETIYSPFALTSFADTLVSILHREWSESATDQVVAFVAAKRLYFGVGGSLDDFVDMIQTLGVNVIPMREETEGVRRGVVKCVLS
jgi:protein-histidine N-methyltransferase